MVKKNILFVCMHNRFRSKVAEAYFKKVNKNKKIRPYSAGIFKGFPVHKNLIFLGKKFGIKIKRKTKGLSERLIKEMDMVIIVANNVPASLFKGKTGKIIIWKIPDVVQTNKKRMSIIMKLIMKKVDKLVGALR